MVLTDLESVVPFLEKNTRFVPTTAPDGGEHFPALFGFGRQTPNSAPPPPISSNPLSIPCPSGGETRLWVTAFPWGEDPAAHALAPPYDMVLAADCIYDVKQVAIFLQSLRYVLLCWGHGWVYTYRDDRGMTD